MGRYRVSMREKPLKSDQQHPIWRGIGCLIIIIVPILSFAAASLSMPYFAKRGLIPNDLLFTPEVPSWLWISPVLVQVFQFLFVRPGILAVLTLTFIYIILIGGIFSVLYAILYRFVGPSRYGPLDAPPPKVKIKKYTR